MPKNTARFEPLVPAALLLLILAAPWIAGCATLREVAALRQVRFTLDRVDEVYLAGVRVDDKRTFQELSLAEAARIGAAIADDTLPLALTAHVEATNPADNEVSARIVRMDWTLFLEDRETVSGRLEEEHRLAPGSPTDVPIDVELDLVQFFSGPAQDLFEVAVAAAGSGRATSVKLEATPTIETVVGPIRYPEPITIVHEEVGGP